MTPGPGEQLDENSLGPARKEDVIAWLRRLARPAEEKRFLYARWARLAGVAVTSEDVQRFTSDANS